MKSHSMRISSEELLSSCLYSLMPLICECAESPLAYSLVTALLLKGLPSHGVFFVTSVREGMRLLDKQTGIAAAACMATCLRRLLSQIKPALPQQSVLSICRFAMDFTISFPAINARVQEAVMF